MMNSEVWYGWEGFNAELFRRFYFAPLPPEAMKVLVLLHEYFRFASFPYWLIVFALIAAAHSGVLLAQKKSSFNRQLRQKALFFTVFISSYLALAAVIYYLKDAFAFPRPYRVFPDVVARVLMEADSAAHSFPSGHAAFAAFLLASCWGSLHWFLKVYGVLLLIVVCASRLMLGLHFPMDVIVGAVLGMLITWIVSGIIKSIWYKTLER